MATQVWVSCDGKSFQTQSAAEEHEKDYGRREEMVKILTKMYNNMDGETSQKYYDLLDDHLMRQTLADFLVMTDVAVLANELLPS